MPYVTRAQRMGLSPAPKAMTADNAGELNFAITKLLDRYLLRHGKNYQKINDCLGACEGAKLEFYRRVVVPYEDAKMKMNGDVYNPEVLKL